MSQRGKDTEVSTAREESFNPNFKEEGVKTRITGDKPGGGIPVFEGWCTSEVILSDFLIDLGNADL